MKNLLLSILFVTSFTVCKSQEVVQVEYFIDSDNGIGKNSLVNLSPSPDGTFPFTVNLQNVSPGIHQVYIRTKDSNGKWSTTARRNIEVLASTTAAKVTEGEYFFDIDPGIGAATPIDISNKDSVILQNYSAATGNLSIGYHKLYLRMKDSNGKWSITARRNVEITPPVAKRKIISGEYFFDSDPGIESATPIAVVNQDSVILQNFAAVTSSLSIGYHKLYIRTKDNEGNWSQTSRRNAEVINNTISVIAGAEYFFDTDTGIGLANQVTFSSPSADSSFTFKIPIDKIPFGSNTLYIRVKDSVNKSWSITQWEKDSVVTSVKTGNWSDPATWSNNKIPDANTVVLLYHNVAVDIDATCKSLAPYRNSVTCNVMTGKLLHITGHK